MIDFTHADEGAALNQEAIDWLLGSGITIATIAMPWAVRSARVTFEPTGRYRPCLGTGTFAFIPRGHRSRHRRPCGVVAKRRSAGDAVLAAVRDVQRALGESFDQDHREWETQVTAAKATKEAWESRVRDAVKAGQEPPRMPAAAVTPQEPERPRIITSDLTPERLGTLLNNNPKGLLSTRDELSGWLLGFDRYSKGGERSFWLEAYGGRPFTIDRVKVGGSVQIDRLSISVFGGLQPDRLTTLLLGSDDDGLPARFIWAWPNPLPPS